MSGEDSQDGITLEKICKMNIPSSKEIQIKIRGEDTKRNVIFSRVEEESNEIVYLEKNEVRTYDLVYRNINEITEIIYNKDDN